jgi:hypothetical protein
LCIIIAKSACADKTEFEGAAIVSRLFTLHMIASVQAVLGLHTGSDSQGEVMRLAAYAALDPQQIAKVALAELVKRAVESNTRLDAQDNSLPYKFIHLTAPSQRSVGQPAPGAALRGLANHGRRLRVKGVKKVQGEVEPLNGRELVRLLAVLEGEGGRTSATWPWSA